MSEQIWVTDALADPEQVYHFSQPQDVRMNIIKNSLDFTYLNAEFVDLQQNFEEKAILTRVVNPINPVPHLMTNGFLFVSEQLRDFLQGFDLGGIHFRHVTLYVNDEQKIPGNPDYYYVNITETKKSFAYKESERLIPRGTYYDFNCSDSTIVVNTDEAGGIDLWMEPLLRGAVFMSDRLYQALQSSGLVERVKFLKCVMVD
ncbi:imm11 family protein [Yoonia vestfoldensis]|uniref:imm11 family protein n=1 Tax=Yoonia vestfoldensis TaxID=245188 RepID=UPI00036DA348|nr:DUF1629 domain-containing protein [Yoonia vestfoldensis]